jgi:hypothetical protein
MKSIQGKIIPPVKGYKKMYKNELQNFQTSYTNIKQKYSCTGDRRGLD